MNQSRDLHLVIRSSGERTTCLARQLATAQLVDESLVTVVNETPFETALRRSYEIGLSADRKWTMTLDADVLLLPNAVSAFIKEAEDMPNDCFQIEGLVYDKVTGHHRPAGHRIYRTAMLDLALNQIPLPGTQLRPEAYSISRMGELGFPSRCCNVIVGLHDFEQYLADLYRKAVLHSAKNRHLVGDIIARCTKHRAEDSDFGIILKGLWDGFNLDQAIVVDANRYADAAAEAVACLGLQEKKPLDYWLDDPALLQLYQQAPPLNLPRNSLNEEASWLDKVHRRLQRRGVVRGSIAALGGALTKLGRRLDA